MYKINNENNEEKVYCGRVGIIIFFSFFLLLRLFAVYQNVFANDVPSLVETQWLADNLRKPHMRLIFVGRASHDNKVKFDGKHIPCSVYLDINSLMDVIGNGSKSPDKAKFNALMGRLGIRNNIHVVLYGTSSRNPFIASAFWLMEYNMHKKVSYLNGGITKWNKEKRETTGKPTKIKPTKYKAVQDESIRANADYVLRNLKNPKVVIVDTRSLDEYKGKNAKETKRAGHIRVLCISILHLRISIRKKLLNQLRI